ncbi:MAG: pyridoxal-phosphate dependent enzyme [Spirochaetia bacterium]|nr:pyridoxal-phosphate dependent enzyme [Spirochaetia bacterium]
MKSDIVMDLKNTVLESIGNTPLLKITHLTKNLLPGIEIWVKLEGANPGGSVKDRPAIQMIKDGIQSGHLTSDKIILDSTSGNTGIALALIGSVLKIPVTLCMPSNVSMERKAKIKSYGAKVIYTSPMEGSDGAILAARELYASEPLKYYKPDQYSNPSNPLAHYLYTGPEIWKQLEGRITHFVATIGTSGTIMGTGRYLIEKNSNIEVYAAEPDDALHGLEGLKHMESSLVPEIYDPSWLDGIIPTPTEPSYEMARLMAHEEGIFAGQSSGAALWAALNLAERLQNEGVREAVIVTILPDSGDKYYSKGLWD